MFAGSGCLMAEKFFTKPTGTAPEKPIGVPAEETKEMKVKMTTSGYTQEGFLEVKPKFEEAIAKAVGAPSGIVGWPASLDRGRAVPFSLFLCMGLTI